MRKGAKPMPAGRKGVVTVRKITLAARSPAVLVTAPAVPPTVEPALLSTPPELDARPEPIPLAVPNASPSLSELDAAAWAEATAWIAKLTGISCPFLRTA